MTPLDIRVPNLICAQATDGSVPERVVMQTLVDYGPCSPTEVRETLQEAVERGDIERVDDGYQPDKWDEYCPAEAK